MFRAAAAVDRKERALTAGKGEVNMEGGNGVEIGSSNVRMKAKVVASARPLARNSTRAIARTGQAAMGQAYKKFRGRPIYQCEKKT